MCLEKQKEQRALLLVIMFTDNNKGDIGGDLNNQLFGYK